MHNGSRSNCFYCIQPVCQVCIQVVYVVIVAAILL